MSDEQERQPGIPEATVWEKIGKQTVEIDLLREKMVELTVRNQALEAQLAELTAATEAEPNGDKSEPPQVARGMKTERP